jgi:hypothetical protein
MAQLGLDQGFVVYPGYEAYSLGGGVTALPAAQVLGDEPSLRRMLRLE